MYRKFLISIVILALVIGGVFAYRAYTEGQFLSYANSEFSKGNYMAALVSYFELNERKDDLSIELKLQQAKESLIAEDNFQRAKAAAEEGDWLETKYLLSDVKSGVDTELYRKIILLYDEASKKVEALEIKIAGELQLLRDEAVEVKLQREQAEKETAEIAGKLSEVEKARELAEQEVDIAKQETAVAQKEAAVERLLKFTNELSLLIDLLDSGSSLVADAIFQIESNNDAVALTFLNQARTLLSNVQEHGKDLQLNRTPESAAFKVDILLSTTSLLKKSVLSLGSATIFIEEQDDFFYQYLNDGKAFYNSGIEDIVELKGFVN